MRSSTDGTRWVPQKADVFTALAAEIVQLYPRGKAIVAIDGVDGAGKSRFAETLVEFLRDAGRETFGASIDGFHRPRAQRYAQGAESPRGFYEDSYDYVAFERDLVEPFRAGQTFATVLFDHRVDEPLVLHETARLADTILVVDGIFLHRPELRGLWNYSIWLDVPAEISARRLVERDGEGADRPRYTEGQAIYVRLAKPRAAATAIYDNTDVEHPRRVFADAC
jgi:uridine kinase